MFKLRLKTLMDKWWHSKYWIHWLLPRHKIMILLRLDLITLLSMVSCLCMSSLQWETRGQSVDTVCCSPQCSAESCIWQPYLENRKLFGLSSSLLLSFYALSTTISDDRLCWSQTYALKNVWIDMFSHLKAHEILYDDVLKRSERHELLKHFAVCNTAKG